MMAFDGIFRSQLDALLDLDNSLNLSGIGSVHVAKALPVHAKATTFSNDNGTKAAIVGSSNLSGLLSATRQFELDVFFDDGPMVEQVDSVVTAVRDTASVRLESLAGQLRVLENPNLVLDGIPGVEKVNELPRLDGHPLVTFDIPIKPEPRSHLNVFFGAGRKQHGHEIPRPWYEVELIVGVEITRRPGYPQAGTPESVFPVVTDDGWRFQCQVQGQNSKNLRSTGDLRILGKWLKERLQNAGVLRIGEPVSAETLARYGRNSLSMTKVPDDSSWFLDFSRPAHD
jgi:hypothetical protein